MANACFAKSAASPKQDRVVLSRAKVASHLLLCGVLVQLTWHNGTLWKVAIEELIVDCNVFIPYCILAVLDLNYAVY